jgi:hypothetical protein
MSGSATRYIEARQNLNRAVREYIETAWKIDKSATSIASDILDSVYEADKQIGELILLEEVM